MGDRRSSGEASSAGALKHPSLALLDADLAALRRTSDQPGVAGAAAELRIFPPLPFRAMQSA